MNRIIRMWNQNRREIIIIALGVVFFFVIIQILNQMAKTQNEQKRNNTIIQNTEKLPTTSIITGDEVSEEKTKTNVELIENFVEACNVTDIEKAYELLSDECKEVLFPTEQYFIANYYNVIFKVERTIKIENYKNSSNVNTYLVTFYEDNISTGNVSSSDYYRDYISIDKETQKLNINSLILAKEINTQAEVDGISISVEKQEIYKDYEIYTIKAENKTDKTVLIDTQSSSKNIYIMNSNNIKNNVSMHEIAGSLLQITQYGAKTIKMKFIKTYNSANKTKKIIFTDIISDYEAYEQNSEIDRLKIEVEV